MADYWREKRDDGVIQALLEWAEQHEYRAKKGRMNPDNKRTVHSKANLAAAHQLRTYAVYLQRSRLHYEGTGAQCRQVSTDRPWLFTDDPAQVTCINCQGRMKKAGVFPEGGG